MRKISIIGIPTDFGANVIGARYAPNRIRKYLFSLFKKLKIDYEDFGNVPIPRRGRPKNLTHKYLKQIKETCTNLAKEKECFSLEYFPIILGGDHTITSCYINEISRSRKIGIIYFDAHGDYNTPRTTPSGNVHGMVLTAVSKGMKLLETEGQIRQKNVVMISTRALDEKESKLLEKSQITVFTNRDVRERGIEDVTKKACRIAEKGTDGFHLSVDLDAVDPKYAPGVSTPVKGGLTKKEVLNAMKIISNHKILSADFVEVNPKRDKNDKTSKLVSEMVKCLV